MAEDYNIAFFESSAKTNKNVSEVFEYLSREILLEQEINKTEEIIKLANDKKKKSQCSK